MPAFTQPPPGFDFENPCQFWIGGGFCLQPFDPARVADLRSYLPFSGATGERYRGVYGSICDVIRFRDQFQFNAQTVTGGGAGRDMPLKNWQIFAIFQGFDVVSYCCHVLAKGWGC
ncbi:hypothetical protein CSC3H3_02175 [Thalassospira marina]|uniref:Uncharacterized protein n=1 Tax=Thalassospira marina TaxID=2048283 RepID=A0ABM6Q5B9_9PROT|nr:hypothetical protein CSC3H3_02175 [Thalassospira marina]